VRFAGAADDGVGGRFILKVKGGGVLSSGTAET
jgi:hypothetical protein